MDDATTRRLTMVVGPAGSGKSVLLAQWAAATGRAERGLAEHHRRRSAPAQPRRPTAAPRCPGWSRRAARSARTVTHHAAELRRLAATRAGILVIEDLDRLLSVALTREVGDLIEGAPDALRFVVTSRVDAVLPLHRLRLLDEVTEIRQADLAFDVSEARPLAHARLARQPLTPGADRRCSSPRTEGWAAGLQLAALSLRDRDDVTAFVEEFSGDDRHVADYFGNEVLEQLPDDVRSFLLQTSVLDTVTPALCAALTERGRSVHRDRAVGLAQPPGPVRHSPARVARTSTATTACSATCSASGSDRSTPGSRTAPAATAGEWHRDRGAERRRRRLLHRRRRLGRPHRPGDGVRSHRHGPAPTDEHHPLVRGLPDAERWANPDIALFYAAGARVRRERPGGGAGAR